MHRPAAPEGDSGRDPSSVALPGSPSMVMDAPGAAHPDLHWPRLQPFDLDGVAGRPCHGARHAALGRVRRRRSHRRRSRRWRPRSGCERATREWCALSVAQKQHVKTQTVGKFRVRLGADDAPPSPSARACLRTPAWLACRRRAARAGPSLSKHAGQTNPVRKLQRAARRARARARRAAARGRQLGRCSRRARPSMRLQQLGPQLGASGCGVTSASSGTRARRRACRKQHCAPSVARGPPTRGPRSSAATMHPQHGRWLTYSSGRLRGGARGRWRRRRRRIATGSSSMARGRGCAPRRASIPTARRRQRRLRLRPPASAVAVEATVKMPHALLVGLEASRDGGDGQLGRGARGGAADTAHLQREPRTPGIARPVRSA